MQCLQTEGGVSRVLQLASLLTRSAFGRPRYRRTQPAQSEEANVQPKEEQNLKSNLKKSD